MSNPNPYQKTKFACYYSYIASAAAFALPPILFVTFHENYGISYTLLGTLVLVGFCIQLGVDLFFSFFAGKLPLKALVRLMPCLTTVGLAAYGLLPYFFPEQAFLGLLFGTILFSLSGGLGEVLISPMIAAMPSDNPERDMSRLHSVYGYGVVFVVVTGSLLLWLWGRDAWTWVTLTFALLPLFCSLMFFLFPIPEMRERDKKEKDSNATHRTLGLWLCVLCIFLGGAAEVTMTNWISVYMENALAIPKNYCDILGLALFALCLALTRTAYAKWGKSIERVMLLSMVLSIACYFVAGLVSHPIVGALAAVLCGFSTAMLWPGTLIFAEKHIKGLSVAAYALLAAGGDLGGSVGPQLVGALVDAVSVSHFAQRLSETLSLTPEQVGIKAGILFGAVFPLAGLFVVISLIRYFKKLQRST